MKPSQRYQRLSNDLKDNPVLIYHEKVDCYPVEFDALEFVAKEELPPIDSAVLSLVEALGVAATSDVISYLGLGQVLGELTFTRLHHENLLEPSQKSPAQKLGGLFGQFLEILAEPVNEGPQRRQSKARKLAPLEEGTNLARLTELGKGALQVGSKLRHFQKPMRLGFTARPFRFIKVLKSDVRNQPIRSLKVSETPDIFLELDQNLGISSELRQQRMGLGESLPGTDGQLLGVNRGSEWRVGSPNKSGCYPVDLICSAGPNVHFTGSLKLGRRWLTGEIEVPNEAFALGNSLPTIISRSEILSQRLERLDSRDGVPCMRLTCQELKNCIGERSVLEDVWIELPPNLGLRIRPVPANETEAHNFFLTLLSNRPSTLKSDFTGTINTTWSELNDFWGWSLPCMDFEDVKNRLWSYPALRRTLCQLRTRADLISPYEEVKT